MDYSKMGNSGLRVSKYALGSVPFSATNGFENAGGVSDKDIAYFIDYALDQGINQFDTANLYAKGDAELALGKGIRHHRDEMVISTKTGFPYNDITNNVGASRLNIERSIDHSLKRLGTDYVDLYYVHTWDGQVPVEETIQAMNDLIRKGKITREKKGEPNTRQGDGWAEPYVKNHELFYRLIECVQDIAQAHNATVPQIILAWLRERPNVDSIVLAARNQAQLKENIASYQLKLTKEEYQTITDLTQPQPIYPLWHRAMNSAERGSDAEKVYLEEYNRLMNQSDTLL